MTRAVTPATGAFPLNTIARQRFIRAVIDRDRRTVAGAQSAPSFDARTGAYRRTENVAISTLVRQASASALTTENPSASGQEPNASGSKAISSTTTR